MPHLAQHVDLAPTILQACGAEVPPAMEGNSILPFITGNSSRPLYDRVIAQECSWQAKWALRTDEYKFILSREKGPDLHGMPPRELYHLPTDPGELRNVADQRPDVVATMQSELEEWIARMMQKNGLAQDPLVAQGITLGKRWHDWVKERGYW